MYLEGINISISECDTEIGIKLIVSIYENIQNQLNTVYVILN